MDLDRAREAIARIGKALDLAIPMLVRGAAAKAIDELCAELGITPPERTSS